MQDTDINIIALQLKNLEAEVADLRLKMSTTDIGTRLLTTAEAARFLGVYESTIRRWCKAGKIKNFGVGRSCRFLASDLAQVSKYTSNQK
jgi:excisionase family DNA binding protein